MTYAEKLKHPKWQKRRLEVLSRDGFACQLCKDKETELHVHHKKYAGEPWGAADDDLITYCKVCHYIIEEFANSNTAITPYKIQRCETVEYRILWFYYHKHGEHEPIAHLIRVNKATEEIDFLFSFSMTIAEGVYNDFKELKQRFFPFSNLVAEAEQQ